MSNSPKWRIGIRTEALELDLNLTIRGKKFFVLVSVAFMAVPTLSIVNAVTGGPKPTERDIENDIALRNMAGMPADIESK